MKDYITVHLRKTTYRDIIIDMYKDRTNAKSNCNRQAQTKREKKVKRNSRNLYYVDDLQKIVRLIVAL